MPGLVGLWPMLLCCCPCWQEISSKDPVDSISALYRLYTGSTLALYRLYIGSTPARSTLPMAYRIEWNKRGGCSQGTHDQSRPFQCSGVVRPNVDTNANTHVYTYFNRCLYIGTSMARIPSTQATPYSLAKHHGHSPMLNTLRRRFHRGSH